MNSAKPVHIEDYQPQQQHPSVSITLMNGYFRAKVHDAVLSSPTLEGLKTDMAARIEVLVSDLPWTPVIELILPREGVREKIDGDPASAEVSLQIKRYHIAVVDTPKDGVKDSQRSSWSGKLSAPWEKKTPLQKMRASKNWYYYFSPSGTTGRYGVPRYDAPRTEEGKLALPCRVEASGGGGEVYMLDYTDETWAGLEALVQSIHDIRSNLKAIAGDADLVRALTTMGSRRLDAAKLLSGMPQVPVLALRAAAEGDYSIEELDARAEPPKSKRAAPRMK